MAAEILRMIMDTEAFSNEIGESIDINNKINQKKRKVFGLLPSEELFLNELAKLNVTGNTIFYKN